MSLTTPNTEAFVNSYFTDAGVTLPIDPGAVTDAEWATVADVKGDQDTAWAMSKSPEYEFIGTAREYYTRVIIPLKA